MNTLYPDEVFTPASTVDELCSQVKRAAGRNSFYSIVPRFTCGSPAQISLYEVARVALQELKAREYCLTGVYGEEKKKLAETKGLDNIAYARWPKGKKNYRYDFLTGKTFVEPPYLSYDERERVKVLRYWKKYMQDRFNENDQRELAALEYRLEIHREKVD